MTAERNKEPRPKVLAVDRVLRRHWPVLMMTVAVGLAGMLMLNRSMAATNVVAVEAESGILAGAARGSSPAGSSGGAAVTFGSTTPPSTETPQIDRTIVVDGRTRIWDLGFTPEGHIIFTERPGDISIRANGQTRVLTRPSDVVAVGEGGMMGMVLDPLFDSNRYLYTCFNTSGDIRLARWRVAADYSGLSERTDILTGLTNGPGSKHNGCRPRFGPDGYLWVGTGDAKVSGTMVSKTSLNGKLLRIDRNGAAAPGNLGQGFDARIYNYGHRNIQGVAFFPTPRGGSMGVTVEHGPLVDDEVNSIKLGNYGWDESSNPYDDNAPMTDKNKYPDAIDAIYKTGPTQALSGVAYLSGSKWKGWDGGIAIAALNRKHLKILRLDGQSTVTREERILEDSEFGRLRTPVLGPDGNLYLTTDGASGGDKILKLTPR